MRGKMTWWRNLGGLLTACVLALLVVAPMASASACQCDDRVATSAAAVSVTQGDNTQHDNSPCDAACCQGGHCHHGGQLLDASITSLPAPAPGAARHVPTRAYALASRPTTGPDRPPRA